MGDDEQGAVEVREELFEPFEAAGVEVVGGLVEEEDIGGLEQRRGQQCAGLLAAGEAGERAVGVEVLDPEAAADLLGARLGGPGAGGLGAFERVGVGVEVARRLERGERLAGLAQGVVEERADGRLGRLLRQVADAGGREDRAAVGVLATGQQPEQGGLAGAVGADEPALSPGLRVSDRPSKRGAPS